MKNTKRKAFNFLRSYFDVLNELKDDSDRLNFLMSIINKQFLNKDPKDLEFIAKLCYESQRHSIESSVKGWIRVNKTDLQGNPLTNPPTNPPTDPPTNPQEEEEEEEVQGEEEEELNPTDISDFKTPTKDVFMIYIKGKMEEKGDIEKYKRVGRSYMISTYDAWKLNNWKDGNDKKIKNWKTKALMQLRYIK